MILFFYLLMRLIPARSMSSETESILHLISHVYVQRTAALWKTNASANWFSEAVATAFPSVATSLPVLKSSPFASTLTLRNSIYRHVVALETPATRSLLSFIPSQTISSRNLACDPLPPPTKVSSYDLGGTFFASLSSDDDPLQLRPRGRRANERMLERLVPDPEFRRQLQALFDGNEALRRQFPGGVVQFAQIAGQFPEVLDDLMIAQFAGDQGGGVGAGAGMVPVQFGDAGMPGGMPDEDVDTDEDNDLPARVAAGPAAGVRAHDDVEEEDDEDEDEDEETEVAVRHGLVTCVQNADRDYHLYVHLAPSRPNATQRHQQILGWRTTGTERIVRRRRGGCTFLCP